MNSIARSFTHLALVCLAALPVQAGDWLQWRGPNRMDHSPDTGLLKQWPEGGPKRVWLYKNGGNGYSGPAVAGTSFYTLGTRNGKEVLIALNANTGEEQWISELGDVLANDWGGGPRGTPTVDGNQVYAMSGKGDLACIQRADGKLVWKKSMSDLGGKIPGWGYTESVLVDGDQVIVTPGGEKGAIAALNKSNGELKWQTKEFTDGAQYSSVIPVTHAGKPQYIQLTMKNYVGVSPQDGKVLWKAPWVGSVAVIPTPIYSEGHVYISSGYGAGSKLIKVDEKNEVTTVYENKVMKNHHGGVILVDGFLYGYSDGPGWICQNFKTGEEVWASKALDKGAVTYADGMLYCQGEGSGNIVLVEASNKAWSEKGRFKLDPQTTIRSKQGRIWTHPVVISGKLYLRDQDLIFCYDVKG